jgi:hypothetical protein
MSSEQCFEDLSYYRKFVVITDNFVIVATALFIKENENKQRVEVGMVLRLEENLQPSEFSNTYQEFIWFESPFRLPTL